MLRINDLNFSYKGSGTLFSELSLGLEKGNIYGLLGRNGAGKTTLLKIMSGLLYPQSGRVTFNGKDVTLRLPEILAETYIIPEEFYLPDITIPGYLACYAPFYPRFDHQVMQNLLTDFELNNSGKLNKLSYGQKKKFMIAFAIATNCSLILMDEPTNGLDIPSKSRFRKAIASAMTEDRTFLISTHQVRDLENLIDPVVIIEEGKIIFQYPIETIASKLSFSRIDDDISPDCKIFYTESFFGGMRAISDNCNGVETVIDFEMLFNAVISERKEIINHLNS
jgi:ABC-2 type transport system ATP-binding protein